LSECFLVPSSFTAIHLPLASKSPAAEKSLIERKQHTRFSLPLLISCCDLRSALLRRIPFTVFATLSFSDCQRHSHPFCRPYVLTLSRPFTSPLPPSSPFILHQQLSESLQKPDQTSFPYSALFSLALHRLLHLAARVS
jgi:hypothetical protein